MNIRKASKIALNYDAICLSYRYITLGRKIEHQKPIVLCCPSIQIKVDHINLMKSEHICGVLTYAVKVNWNGFEITERLFDNYEIVAGLLMYL